MSKIDEIADKQRPLNIGVNRKSQADEYDAGDPNALSDGDEFGKGETDTVGGTTDIKKRAELKKINLFSSGNEYPPTQG